MLKFFHREGKSSDADKTASLLQVLLESIACQRKEQNVWLRNVFFKGTGGKFYGALRLGLFARLLPHVSAHVFFGILHVRAHGACGGCRIPVFQSADNRLMLL